MEFERDPLRKMDGCNGRCGKVLGLNDNQYRRVFAGLPRVCHDPAIIFIAVLGSWYENAFQAEAAGMLVLAAKMRG